MSEIIKFSIEPATGTSIEQLRKLPVNVRTSHAGNLSKTSQQLPTSAGTEIQAFSGNQGSDPTYTPRQIDFGGNHIEIALASEPSQKLTAFTVPNRSLLPELSQGFKAPAIIDALSIAQVHISAGQELWGENKVQPYHSIFQTPTGEEVLTALASIPNTCDRFLTTDGVLEPLTLKTVDPRSLINTMQSIAESSTPGREVNIKNGPILSNEANTVAHAFISALPFIRDGGQMEVKIGHSSGPDMIKYTQKPNFQAETQRIAQTLAEKLQLRDISISELIYPASELRMSCQYSEKAELAFEKFSTLTDLVLALQFEGDLKNSKIIDVSIKYGLKLDPFGKVTTEAKNAVNLLASELGQMFPHVPGLNFKPRQLTQWDMLGDSRKPPIIPKAFLHMDIEQIKWFTRLAEQIAHGNTTNIPKVMPDELKPR